MKLCLKAKLRGIHMKHKIISSVFVVLLSFFAAAAIAALGAAVLKNARSRVGYTSLCDICFCSFFGIMRISCRQEFTRLCTSCSYYMFVIFWYFNNCFDNNRHCKHRSRMLSSAALDICKIAYRTRRRCNLLYRGADRRKQKVAR